MIRRTTVALAAAAILASVASAASHPNATAVVKALQKAGLPINGYVVYTAATDPNHLLGRPSQYVSKVNFHDRRLTRSPDYDTDGGGSVETFTNTADAKARFKYVQAIAKVPLFAEYDYLDGTVLLRLSNTLTPAQATAYKRALFRVA